MFTRNGSVSGGTTGGRTPSISKPTTIKPKKKPAPPRPPQPKINRLQSSQSFNDGFNNPAADLTSTSVRNPPLGRPAGKDLIDFDTPPGSPSSNRRNTISNISTAKDPNEFSYRVGASIFYVKSQLKNSSSATPVQNPFSPPRPSAETILQQHPPGKPHQSGATQPPSLQSNINSAWSTTAKPATTNLMSAWDTPPHKTHQPNISNAAAGHGGGGGGTTQYQNMSSLENNNTIKSHYQNQSAWIPAAGVSSSSNASSNRSTGSFSDFGGHPGQPRYGNIPAEPGKKELSATLSSGSGKPAIGIKPKAPTIIRPANKLSAQLSKDESVPGLGAPPVSSAVVTNAQRSSPMQRNYYDVPPEEEEEEEDDDDDFDEPTDSSFVSPPMPSEPPPPPPVDLAVDEWVNSTTGVTDYPDTYSDAGQGSAYAVALYDFTPEVEGDLSLQVGDLVYLLRKIDDSWFYGSCGGMVGMLPANFINVVVPLPEDSTEEQAAVEQAEVAEEVTADVLYDFTAETDSDLSLQTGEKIKLLGRINDDWLYGEKNGTKGQFPAAFVQHYASDLPIINIST